MAFYRDAEPFTGSAFFVDPGRARHRIQQLTALVSLAAALLGTPTQAQQPLPAISLQVASHAIQVELAATPDALRTGLMDRPSMPADAGMLFALGPPDIHCFWMKNTLIPLSIAFIDRQGRIVDIQDMQPRSLDPHCPPAPITTALEMNQGWFDRAGIRTGDTVRGIPTP